jgi:hypothetical protein
MGRVALVVGRYLLGWGADGVEEANISEQEQCFGFFVGFPIGEKEK